MKKLLSILLALLLAAAVAAPAFAADEEPALPYPDSQFFTVGDYTLHYRVKAAAEEKARILLLHGFAESTYCWEQLVPYLTEAGYTCVLMDLPDFGYSSRETAETAVLPREDLVYALMQELGGGSWYVGGHSMGGHVALAVAQKYPEAVRHLLLFGTSGNDGSSARLGFLLKIPGLLQALGKVMGAAAKSAFLVKLFLRMGLQDNAYASAYDPEEIMRPLRAEGTGEGAMRNFLALTATDYKAVAKMPAILFINGDNDKIISDDQRADLRAALPAGSEDIVIPGAGHMFIENMAAETAEYTLSFLANNP